MLTSTREADDIDKDAGDVCGIRSVQKARSALARSDKTLEALGRTESLRRTCSSTTRRGEGCTGPQYGNDPFESRSIL